MINDILVAGFSGLFASISGCALPIYPILLGQITQNKENPKIATLFFSTGISGVFFLFYGFMAVLISFMNYDLIEQMGIWQSRLLLIGALIAWLMAFMILRGKTFSPKTVQLLKGDSKRGYFGSFLSGFFYGTIISPCNAAFLITGILPAISNTQSTIYGFIMLGVFSIGLSLPLLLIGWIGGHAIQTLGIFKKNMRKIEITSGIFLIIAGFYFLKQFLLTLSFG